MATYLFFRHRVRDFAAWKPVFDAHRAKRVEAGLTDKHVLQDSANPNDVFVLFEVRDLARAKAFVESADLRTTMEKAGVVAHPGIHFLRG